MELLATLSACFVFALLVGAMFAFAIMRRRSRDQQYNQETWPAVDDPEQIEKLQAELEKFVFGQRGGKTTIRSAARTRRGILLNILQTRAAPASDSDFYSGLMFRLPKRERPSFVLRVRSAAVDNAVQRALFGATPEISLEKWPDLVDLYQCLGSSEKEVIRLLSHGLADWLIAELEKEHRLGVEHRDGLLLVTRYERDIPNAEQLKTFVVASESAMLTLS